MAVHDHDPPTTQAQCESMAAEFMEGLQSLERVIQQLPDLAPEEQQLQELAGLQAESAAAARHLACELEAAQAKLAQLQGVYGALADASLQQ